MISFALIVEGHGEVEALPILVRRVLARWHADVAVQVLRPFRVARQSVVKAGELERYVALAGLRSGPGGAVLVVLDADDDCPARLGPALLSRAQAQLAGERVGVCIAVREFESWFLAAAESIAGRRGLAAALETPLHHETIRDAKGWLQDQRTDRQHYSETIDQPKLAAVFDIELARTRSESFDKLCREIARLTNAAQERA